VDVSDEEEDDLLRLCVVEGGTDDADVDAVIVRI
jgi:hypothetical protein